MSHRTSLHLVLSVWLSGAYAGCIDTPQPIHTPNNISQSISQQSTRRRPAPDLPDEYQLYAYAPSDILLAGQIQPGGLLRFPGVDAPLIMRTLRYLDYVYSPRDTLFRTVWLDMLDRSLLDLELVVYLFQESQFQASDLQAVDTSVEALAAGGPLVDAYILRFSEPIDEQQVRSLFYQGTNFEVDGKQCWGSAADDAAAMFFIDTHSFAVGRTSLIRKMIAGASGPSGIVRTSLDTRKPLAIAFQFETSAADFPVRLDPATLAVASHLKTGSVRFGAWPEFDFNANLFAKKGTGDEVLIPIREAKENYSQIAIEDAEEASQQQWKSSLLLRSMVEQADVATTTDSVVVRLDGENRWCDVLGAFSLVDTSDESIKAVMIAAKHPAENETAEEIRRLAPQALGYAWHRGRHMSPEHFTADERRQWGPTALPLTDEFVQAPKIVRERFPAWNSEFSFVSGSDVQTRDIHAAISRNGWFGYATMAPLEYITKVTATVHEDSASGFIAFEAPHVYRGKIHYEAQKQESRWRITRLRLAERKWEWERNEQGEWQGRDQYGSFSNADRFPNLQQVSGKIEGVGDSLRILFVLRSDPAFHRVAAIQKNGAFDCDLRPGAYEVLLVTDLGELHLGELWETTIRPDQAEPVILQKQTTATD